MLIGVLSDTHLFSEDILEGRPMFRRLASIVLDAFKDVDEIIHAGDVISPEVIDYLSRIAPVLVVRGNGDFDVDGDHWKKSQCISRQDVKIAIAHQRVDLLPYVNEGVSVFIFGHSHIPVIERNEDGTIWMNPGSIKRPCGSNRKPSIGFLRIEGKKIEVWLQEF
jgi:hypothetical protein